MCFNELVQYKNEHGNCKVPQTYKLNKQLARWVYNTRSRPQQQSKERIKRLTELGLDFGRREPTWEQMYQKLLAFKKEFGQTSPSTKDFLEIGFWVIS
ncbi:MAG: helicase associated domain-containing protein [bacterium]|nr:helicase associated domain-containing protein [bacterium]